MPSRLLFLHLSDIHFEKPHCLDPEMDLDRPVRTAILNDAIKLCENLGDVDAILVTGDIAYHGDSEEYEIAKEWLDDISQATKCIPSNIYTVPGNHDINWEILDKNRITKALRKDILSVDVSNRYKKFHQILTDDKTAPEFMEPLKPYNEFAARYNCALSAPGKPFWIDELPFNDSLRIRFYGLTSCLFSGPNDVKGNLYLGDIQTAFDPSNDVVNIALMHHPHDWFSDGEEVEDALWNNTKLHLIGHRHKQRILPTDYGVRLSAGAVNPARNERNWEPGYNFIELLLTEEKKQSVLTIKAHLRNWQSSPDKFIARQANDGSNVFMKRIVLGPSTMKFKKEKADTNIIEKAHETNFENHDMPADSNKRLVYQFWDLASSERREITSRLGLLSKEELKLPVVERYKRAFKNAKDRNLVKELTDAIQNTGHLD